MAKSNRLAALAKAKAPVPEPEPLAAPEEESALGGDVLDDLVEQVEEALPLVEPDKADKLEAILNDLKALAGGKPEEEEVEEKVEAEPEEALEEEE